jgi:putative ABC transport system substrate-binding protein
MPRPAFTVVPPAAIRLLAVALFLAAALLLAATPVVDAQPARPARIGYLSQRPGPASWDEAFRQGLRELGYVEGTNLAIEYRWAAWRQDRLRALAAELVGLDVDVIVATGGAAVAAAARSATSTIPIVFTAGDALGAGLVPSLARPGGNLTGVNLLNIELSGKRLTLLKETVPAVTRIGILSNPANPSARQRKDAADAARRLGVGTRVAEVRDPHGLEAAFARLARERVGALLVLADPMFLDQRDRIVALARQHRLPAIYEWREFVDAGGLMSYWPSIAALYRLLATYVAKPGDLPVEQPTTFDLVINVATAKALGLAIPASVQLRATEVVK